MVDATRPCGAARPAHGTFAVASVAVGVGEAVGLISVAGVRAARSGGDAGGDAVLATGTRFAGGALAGVAAADAGRLALD